MKFKLGKIEGIYSALIDICRRSDIIAKTSYWLGKFKNKVESEYKLYQEQEGKLRDKYGAWKYRLEKETTKDGEIVKDVQILTLKGTENNKHWENEKGERVEFNESMDKRRIYWQGNSDEDTKAFLDELKSLQEQEFEISYAPINLNRIVGKYGDEHTEITISGEVLAELDGIIVDIEETETK